MTITIHYHIDMGRQWSLEAIMPLFKSLTAFFPGSRMELQFPHNYVHPEDPAPWFYSNRIRFFDEADKEEPPFYIIDVTLYCDTMDEQVQYLLISPDTRDTEAYIKDRRKELTSELERTFGARVLVTNEYLEDTPELFRSMDADKNDEA